MSGDPDKLARVFNNILKNAAAYSEDNSIIDITAGLSGDVALMDKTGESSETMFARHADFE